MVHPDTMKRLSVSDQALAVINEHAFTRVGEHFDELARFIRKSGYLSDEARERAEVVVRNEGVFREVHDTYAPEGPGPVSPQRYIQQRFPRHRLGTLLAALDAHIETAIDWTDFGKALAAPAIELLGQYRVEAPCYGGEFPVNAPPHNASHR